MKILLSWLQEFVEISLHPQSLAERLTLSGAEVTALSRLEGDWLFELEVTPNRPDLLSHLGIARETAAVLGRTFRLKRALKAQMRPLDQPPPDFSVEIADPKRCPRYCGVVIEGISVKESSPELARRLKRLGVRPVNNVVDVTNLCLLEMGQPLHAFDLDRLEGRAVRVRGAVPKETLVTLDGVSRPLPPGTLVIADRKRPVALAGVMGGRDTEITAATRRVFLESARFSPSGIRRISRGMRLSSDSSYRFERGVDPEMVPRAALRAARWIREVAGGRINGGLIDVGESRRSRRTIALQPAQAQRFLGMKIVPAQQRRFLERLGCRVAGSIRSLRVEPPSWRDDLRIPEDLCEELARLWGYDRCAATLPPVARQDNALKWKSAQDPWIDRQRQIRRWLSSAGMQEIMTYSLVHPSDQGRLQRESGRGVLALENPLSVDQAVLRGTLQIGALQTVARNLNRRTADALRLFEIGRVFGTNPAAAPPLPVQPAVLGLTVAGSSTPSWGNPSRPLGVFDLKGIVRFLGDRLRVNLSEEVHSLPGFAGPGLLFMLEGKPFGFGGRVAPVVLAAFDIPEEVPVAYAELSMDFLTEVPPAPVRVRGLPKVPSVFRDLAILVPARGAAGKPLEAGRILEFLEGNGGPLLKGAALFDLYQGPQVPAGRKSLAFRLEFSAGDRTLTDGEIGGAFEKIVQGLKAAFGAELR